MYDGIYSLVKYARIESSVLTDFPLIVVEVQSGRHMNLCFHTHDTMELAIITVGEGWHIFNGKKVPIQKGDVLLIPPEISHAYENGDPPLGVMNIIFDGNRLPIPPLDGETIPLFEHFFPSVKRQKPTYSAKPILHVSDDTTLIYVLSQCRRLHEELTHPLPGNVLSSLTLFLNVVMTLLRCATSEELKMERDTYGLWNVLKFVNEHFTEPLTLEQLAVRSFLSVRTFQTKFKRLTGCSVMDYIIRKRIALARLLLTKTPARIQEVAFTCGFQDSSYFTRIFRKIAGISPLQFKNQAEKSSR